MTETSPKTPAENETLDHRPDARVALILDQYLEDIQNGRACSREELLNKHPDLRNSLVEYLDGIDLVAGLGMGNDLISGELGDFKIEEPIGQGAMGTVYKAKQLSLKRDVALKVLRYAMTSPQAHKRFEREAELVATLRHSHIVPVYATGKQDGSHYLAMQLIDGPSLSAWSSADGANRDAVKIAQWGAQVARALAHAHQHDVIHRDIKPSNLLKDGDHIWLTDFGLARRYDDIRMSMTGAMLGTPNYMSPEQASPGRHPIDYRTDIYSLGATLFELLTGRCVFQAKTPHSVLAQLLSEEPTPLREVIPSASRDLETILMKCLEKDPADRFQTAQSLAEDLEAFAAGNSIAARRPILTERVSRWRRQNRKAFTWAATATAAALTLLAVSATAWFAWARATSGSIGFDSDEGPLVARLIDDQGNATSHFSIPTKEDLTVKQGEYTLQMWAGGSLGESHKVVVDGRSQTKLEIKLTDHGLFPARTVEGFPAVLPLKDRDDLIFFHSRGINRVDGRSGESLWTAKSKDFVDAVNRSSSKKAAKMASRVVPLSWGRNFDSIREFDDPKIPHVVQETFDANGDGEVDVMILTPFPSVLMVFDGTDGDLIWHRPAPISTMQQPVAIGDIDEDGAADFLGIFSIQNSLRRAEAFSGKTGKQIWTRDLPDEWFDKNRHRVPILGMSHTGNHSDTHFLSWGQGSWRHNPFRNTNMGFYSGAIKPWPVVFSERADNSELLYLCGGDRLITMDRKTGKPGKLNDSNPIDLGFFPALPPKPIRDADGQCIGLLTCEVISVPDPDKSIAACSRFSLWSCESGKKLWSHDAECDPAWMNRLPDWPVVADLAGDSTPEILIVDGSELDVRWHDNPSGLSSLQLLDSKTGETLWDPAQRASIRSQNRQIQSLTCGSPSGPDQKSNIYVVSAVGGFDPQVYVDVIDGPSGRRLKTHPVDVPFFANNFTEGLEFETPVLLGPEGSLDQQLVIATRAWDQTRQNTAVLSLRTGEVTHVGSQLENPFLADGDGDGNKDLFLTKPRSRSRIDLSSQLVSLKANAGSGISISSSLVEATCDIDGDGVRDLYDVSETPPGFSGNRHYFSGANGKLLSQSKSNFGTLQPLDDLDGDGVNDFAMENQNFSVAGHSSTIGLIGGKDGNLIWNREFACGPWGAQPRYASENIDGEGAPEFLMFHQGTQQTGSTQLQLSCLDATSGDVRWSSLIEAGTLTSNNPSYLSNAKNPYRLADINEDGVTDIICPFIDKKNALGAVAIDGSNGKHLWQLPGAAVQTNSMMPPWRFQIVPATDDTEALIVQVDEVATVSFFKLVDGTAVSQCEFEARLPDLSLPKHQESLVAGIPFVIHGKVRNHVGVYLNDFKTGGFIAVFDASQERPDLTYRLDFRDLTSKEHYAMGNDQVVILDQGPGETSITSFLAGDDLIAFDLVNNKELARRKMPGIVELGSDSGDCLLRVVINDGVDASVELLDPKTLGTVWDVSFPPQMKFDSVLAGGLADDGKTYQAPSFLFRQSDRVKTVYCSSRAEAEFKGETDRLQPIAKPISLETASADPRLIFPLPWNQRYDIPGSSFLGHLLSTLSQEVPVAIGLIIFPAFFLWAMFRKKRWSLRTFMLLPLLFVIPWLALSLPGNETTFLIGGTQGIPETKAKALVALFTLPALLYVGELLFRVWKFQWTRLFRLVTITVLLSLAYAAFQFLFNDSSLPPGGRYDFFDPSSLLLLEVGAWLLGVWIAFRIVISLLLQSLKNLRRPRPELA